MGMGMAMMATIRPVRDLTTMIAIVSADGIYDGSTSGCLPGVYKLAGTGVGESRLAQSSPSG